MLPSNIKLLYFGSSEVKEAYVNGQKIYSLSSDIPSGFGDENTTGGFLAVNSWAEVQNIVKSGQASTYFSVNDRIGIKLSSTFRGESYLLFRVIGFDKIGSNTMLMCIDKLYEGFQSEYTESDRVKWDTSLIKPIVDDLFNYFPADLQSVIADTTYYHYNNYYNGTSSTTSKIFITSLKHETWTTDRLLNDRGSTSYVWYMDGVEGRYNTWKVSAGTTNHDDTYSPNGDYYYYFCPMFNIG